MLPLDHIPFYDPDPDPDALALGFGRLGFTASAPSRQTTADHPEAEWRRPLARPVLTILCGCGLIPSELNFRLK